MKVCVTVCDYTFLHSDTEFNVAMGWLEYCNSDKDTYYANLRRKNGREKPYNVKYWALGNECWGPWQVEQMTKEYGSNDESMKNC